jgi:hypothetical protein
LQYSQSLLSIKKDINILNTRNLHVLQHFWYLRRIAEITCVIPCAKSHADLWYPSWYALLCKYKIYHLLRLCLFRSSVGLSLWAPYVIVEVTFVRLLRLLQFNCFNKGLCASIWCRGRVIPISKKKTMKYPWRRKITSW